MFLLVLKRKDLGKMKAFMFQTLSRCVEEEALKALVAAGSRARGDRQRGQLEVKTGK